jgi:hypothetical protein
VREGIIVPIISWLLGSVHVQSSQVVVIIIQCVHLTSIVWLRLIWWVLLSHWYRVWYHLNLLQRLIVIFSTIHLIVTGVKLLLIVKCFTIRRVWNILLPIWLVINLTYKFIIATTVMFLKWYSWVFIEGDFSKDVIILAVRFIWILFLF